MSERKKNIIDFPIQTGEIKEIKDCNRCLDTEDVAQAQPQAMKEDSEVQDQNVKMLVKIRVYDPSLPTFFREEDIEDIKKNKKDIDLITFDDQELAMTVQELDLGISKNYGVAPLPFSQHLFQEIYNVYQPKLVFLFYLIGTIDPRDVRDIKLY